MSIRENRLFIIEHKVLTLKNIQELAKVIWDDYHQTKPAIPSAFISFAVKCYDRSSFESEDINIFAENSAITKKRVQSVVMEFRAEKNKFIKIHLTNGNLNKDQLNENSIEVGGEDSFWVSGIMDTLATLMASFPEQEKHVFKYIKYLSWAILPVIIYTIGPLADWANKSAENYVRFWYDKNEFGENMFTAIFLGALATFFLNNYIAGLAADMWPKVELQIGPEHLYIEKKRRGFIVKAFTLLVLPIILSIVSTYITNQNFSK